MIINIVDVNKYNIQDIRKNFIFNGWMGVLPQMLE